MFRVSERAENNSMRAKSPTLIYAEAVRCDSAATVGQRMVSRFSFSRSYRDGAENCSVAIWWPASSSSKSSTFLTISQKLVLRMPLIMFFNASVDQKMQLAHCSAPSSSAPHHMVCVAMLPTDDRMGVEDPTDDP